MFIVYGTPLIIRDIHHKSWLATELPRNEAAWYHMHLSQLMPPLMTCITLMTFLGSLGWFGMVRWITCHVHHSRETTTSPGHIVTILINSHDFLIRYFCLNGTSSTQLFNYPMNFLFLNPSDWNPVWWFCNTCMAEISGIWSDYLSLHDTKRSPLGLRTIKADDLGTCPTCICAGANLTSNFIHPTTAPKSVMSVAETWYLKVAPVRWLPGPCHVLYVLFEELNAIPKAILNSNAFLHGISLHGWILNLHLLL